MPAGEFSLVPAGEFSPWASGGGAFRIACPALRLQGHAIVEQVGVTGCK